MPSTEPGLSSRTFSTSPLVLASISWLSPEDKNPSSICAWQTQKKLPPSDKPSLLLTRRSITTTPPLCRLSTAMLPNHARRPHLDSNPLSRRKVREAYGRPLALQFRLEQLRAKPALSPIRRAN